MLYNGYVTCYVLCSSTHKSYVCITVFLKRGVGQAIIGCLLHILDVVANNTQCTYWLAANYCDNLLIMSTIYLHVGVALCRRHLRWPNVLEQYVLWRSNVRPSRIVSLLHNRPAFHTRPPLRRQWAVDLFMFVCCDVFRPIMSDLWSMVPPGQTHKAHKTSSALKGPGSVEPLQTTPDLLDRLTRAPHDWVGQQTRLVSQCLGGSLAGYLLVFAP